MTYMTDAQAVQTTFLICLSFVLYGAYVQISARMASQDKGFQLSRGEQLAVWSSYPAIIGGIGGFLIYLAYRSIS